MLLQPRPLLMIFFLALPTPSAFGETIELITRSRDVETGEPEESRLTIDPKRTGLVVIDMWNKRCRRSPARRFDRQARRRSGTGRAS